jgi:ParB-like chromosome segregation protein Spo0J
VAYRPPADLRAYERNARTHSAAQVEQIAASILQFGFNNPILLKDDGKTIGAGHGRQMAAQLILSRGQRLPTPDGASVPTITLQGLTEAEWRAYVLADNKLALNADWDTDLLAQELAAISQMEPDLAGLVGFSQAELDQLLGTELQTDDPDPAGSSFRYEEQFAVIVPCASEAEQQKTFESLTAAGYACKVVVT